MSNESTPNQNESSASDSIFETLESNVFDGAGDESPEQVVDLLEQQLADLKDRELKAQAELENFRKRLLRDTEQQLKYALLPFVRDLVEVVDNLNRASDAATSSDDRSRSPCRGQGGEFSTA